MTDLIGSVFISYGHGDVGQVNWLKEVRRFLDVLTTDGIARVWDDDAIPTGEKWFETIRRAAVESDAVVLLVGPSFLSSRFVDEHELPWFLDMASQHETRLFPVLVATTPHSDRLRSLQFVNDTPLELLSSEDRNKVLAKLTDEVRSALEVRDRPTGRVAVFGDRPTGSPVFTGRDTESRLIEQLLDEDRIRIIAVVGAGGFGKTTLAFKVLSDLEQRGRVGAQRPRAVAGIAYLSTRDEAGITLGRIFKGCAELLEHQEHNAARQLQRVWEDKSVSLDDKLARLFKSLQYGLYIFLLDNIEDLLGPNGRIVNPELGALFDRLLRVSGHNLRVIVTSRRNLVANNDEWQTLIGPVPLREGLNDNESVELLTALLSLRRIEVPERPQLVDAAQATFGVPRAIYLFVSLVERETLATVSEVAARFLGPRSDIVERLFESNCQRLPADAMAVLRALAVFAVPVRRDAIAALVPPGTDVPAGLGELSERYMASIDRDRKTVALHPLDQAYVYNSLPQDSEWSRAQLHRRAADYIDSQLKLPATTKGHLGVDVWLDPETHRSIVSMYQHRVKATQLDEAAELLVNYGPNLPFRGDASSAAAMMELAKRAPQTDRWTLGVAATQCALRCVLGPLAEATPFAQQAIDAAKRLGSPKEEAAANVLMAGALRYLGEIRRAIDHFERALQLYEAFGDRTHEPYRFGDLSLSSLFAGNVKDGLRYGQRLLAAGEERSDRDLQFLAHNCLCLAYLVWRRWDDVVRQASEALALWSPGMHDGNIYVINLTALAHYHVGKIDDALATFSKGEREALKYDHVRPRGICVYNSALVHYMTGNHGEAVAAARRAVPILSATGLSEPARGVASLMKAVEGSDARAEVVALLDLARASVERPDLFAARELISRALQVSAQSAMADLTAEAESLLAMVTCRLVLPEGATPD